jgi:hypothetical protein
VASLGYADFYSQARILMEPRMLMDRPPRLPVTGMGIAEALGGAGIRACSALSSRHWPALGLAFWLEHPQEEG